MVNGEVRWRDLAAPRVWTASHPMCAVGWVMRDTMEVGLMLSALRMRLSAQRASFRYIETRDNRKRRHSPLGYVPPK